VHGIFGVGRGVRIIVVVDRAVEGLDFGSMSYLHAIAQVVTLRESSKTVSQTNVNLVGMLHCLVLGILFRRCRAIMPLSPDIVVPHGWY